MGRSEAQITITATVAPQPKPDFDVVIAAPAVVAITRSPIVPVGIVVRRKDSSKPLPAKLIFLASNGLRCKLGQLNDNESPFKDGNLVLDGTQPLNTVLVSLQRLGIANSFRVAVFTNGNPAQKVAEQEIQVRRPTKAEFDPVPSEVRADGKATPVIGFRVLDQNGAALPDAQFFLRDFDSIANADIALSAVTDAQGRASFRLPAMTRGTHLIPQLTFVSPFYGGAASSQFDIIYRGANNPDEKPVVPDPLWWKKGWILRY